MNALVVSGEHSISIDSSAIEWRDGLVEESAEITSVSDGFLAEEAIGVCKKLDAAIKGIEADRVVVKSPILDAGRKVDRLASEFCEPLKKQVDRIRGMLNKFAADQAKAEAERRRRADEERIRIELEKRKADEALAREREAIAAANRAAEQKESAFTAEEVEEAKSSQLAAEIEAEKARIEKAEAEAKIAAAAASVKPALSAPAPAIATKVDWQFEVVDIGTVYRNNPLLCRVEISTAAVKRAIADGHINIPGLRIWSEVKAK